MSGGGGSRTGVAPHPDFEKRARTVTDAIAEIEAELVKIAECTPVEFVLFLGARSTFEIGDGRDEDFVCLDRKAGAWGLFFISRRPSRTDFNVPIAAAPLWARERFLSISSRFVTTYMEITSLYLDNRTIKPLLVTGREAVALARTAVAARKGVKT